MMFSINKYSHKPFLEAELNKLLREDSFAYYMAESIGSELHERLVNWIFKDETEYSRLFPVDALFNWVSQHEGLDPEWLANDKGGYIGDNGKEIPPYVIPTYSAEEQLASYGLWLLRNEIGILGEIPEGGYNSQGCMQREVIEHQAECLLLAYQALSYAQKIRLGTPPTVEESESLKKAAKLLAQKGADVLHNKPGGSRDKAQQMRNLWATGKYTSRDICAEQECAFLNMSFSSARKALRNTPEPKR